MLRRIAKLEKKIKHNSKCEHDVYSKMFTRSEKDVMSVTDYVEKSKVVLEPIKSTLDHEIDDEFAKIKEEVQRMIEKKQEELSFELLPESERKTYPEFAQLQDLIDQAREGLKLSKKLGKQQEYLLLRGKAKELIFAKEHLLLTLNMDLAKPTQRMVDMAASQNIDLKDTQVIEEFQAMQLQNLEDIRRIRDGKPPLTETELKTERAQILQKISERRIRQDVVKQRTEDDAVVKTTERILTLINDSKTNMKERAEQ